MHCSPLEFIVLSYYTQHMDRRRTGPPPTPSLTPLLTGDKPEQSGLHLAFWLLLAAPVCRNTLLCSRHLIKPPAAPGD